LGVAFLSTSLACGEDVIPVAPVVQDDPDPATSVTDTTTVSSGADVDGYFQSLPAWSEYATPVSDAEVVAAEPSFYEQSGNMFCSVTEASITRNPEDIVTYSPDSEIMWLGALIQGRGHRDGLGSLLELPIRQRAPATIAIDILFSDNTRTVQSPTLASVGQAIGELIDQAHTAGHLAGSSIFFNQVESHSLEQSVLKLGLSASYMGSSIRSSLAMERETSSSMLTATFTQKMFTTSLVLPQSPQSFFSDEFTEELLQEQIDRENIGPNNLPVYVASITWGRMLTVTMTSNHSAAEMKAALQASSSFAGFDVSIAADAAHKKVLDESEIKVVAIGGHAQAAIDLIRTGQLGEYFKDDAPLTTARPISYVLRNLGDNTIAKVSETTEYAIRECEPGGVQRFANYASWRDSVASKGLFEDSLMTTEQNVTKASGLAYPIGGNYPIGPRATWLADSTGLPFDFYLENTNAAELTTAYQQSWTLVFADQEIGGSPANRWISIGDADGIDQGARSVFENDDFDIRMIRNDTTSATSDVYAIALTIGGNDDTGGPDSYFRFTAPADQDDGPFLLLALPGICVDVYSHVTGSEANQRVGATEVGDNYFADFAWTDIQSCIRIDKLNYRLG
jgi:hypothetical protein